MAKHTKHAKLVRPLLGSFNKLEFAILGTTCGKIQKLSKDIIQILGKYHPIAYVDTSHKKGDDSAINLANTTWDATIKYTDQIDYHELIVHRDWNKFDYLKNFRDLDLVLVNGNHHTADAQILVIDPIKEESNKRKIEKFSNVKLVILGDCIDRIPDYLIEAIPEITEKPILSINNIEKIVHFLHEEIRNSIPPLQGLILAGGKSIRMGQDKAMMNFHGQAQYAHLSGLLSKQCDLVHISCRTEQISLFPEGSTLIKDSFTNLGPFGALLSAFQKNPNTAYLVAACDLPLLDSNIIDQLVKGRNPSKYATAFIHPDTDFPEPLISIWEPKSYGRLLDFLSLGYSCPRKVLINSDIELLRSENSTIFTNVNRPEEVEYVNKIISQDHENV